MITESEGYKRIRSGIDRNATKWGNGHDYEGKLAWIVERAQHYADMTGLDASDILNAWEKQRDYWYMNFYQDAKQPRIDAGVRVFETQEALREAVGTAGFRCPACSGVSKSPYACDSGIVRDGKPCDWKSYGLFGTLGKGCSIFVKDKMVVDTVFMPLAFEVAS